MLPVPATFPLMLFVKLHGAAASEQSIKAVNCCCSNNEHIYGQILY